MIDVLRAPRAARRIAVLGEMLELGRAAEALHRAGGRLRGAARSGRADRRARPGAADGGSGGGEVARRSFSRTRSRRGNSSARWRAGRRGAVQGIARGAHGAGSGEVSGSRAAAAARCFTILLYEQLFRHVSAFRVFRYTTFRTAFASMTALFLCIALGPWLITSCGNFKSASSFARKAPSRIRKRPERRPWAGC